MIHHEQLSACDDEITGGAGADTITGGNQADTFKHNKGTAG